MAADSWFDDVPVIGNMTPEVAADKLRELANDDLARELEEESAEIDEAPVTTAFLFRRSTKPWQHTGHAFGYLAPAAPGSQMLPIVHAGNIAPDTSLSRITVTLDRLRVAAYPGGGIHHVLFDFYAQNSAQQQVEHLHFNTTVRAQEGEATGIIGYPIFVGLNVGTAGVNFKCFTVNVKNDRDESFLRFLESDVFKEGLKLATTLQPAIALFSETALGLTKAIASRRRNVPVQDFFMGLDFSQVATRARLAPGSYIAVQIPESSVVAWDWSEWVYNPNNGRIVNQGDPTQLIPFNYVVIGVSATPE